MLYNKIQATIQYALVCRQWLAFLKPRLCSTLYIKSHPPKLSNLARFKNVLKGLRSPKPHKFWTSNIKSVVSMDGARYAKALYILNSHRGPIPTLDVFLDGYGFG
ncbi:hypothetical protein DL89DRAFT_8329 [Linderina pennispora]|uniref:Uncharacterized protein n=1 Tax=Linderina pennispora TaxID=61395 RepID=A0A1Y1WL45_9FUNG|nr:uncharacterized protein DL89DRAFT_8329 [Linderina pennispora]ORX74028.1 hypothetical protein DL89DRAFT_8329 [Linderina pennispora]